LVFKTYVGRPEADLLRQIAMTRLGSGLYLAKRFAEASSVYGAELSTLQRLGASEYEMLIAKGNLALTYEQLGQDESALSLEQEVFFGFRKLLGEEHPETLQVANNYATTLLNLQRYGETKSLMRKTVPVAHRVLGADNRLTLTLRSNYAMALYKAAGATLDDLREAETTFEETERIARRVMGGAHPLTLTFERDLRDARAVLRAREAPSPGAA